MQQNTTALVWFTNNLRIRDNQSLHLATNNYERVIAVYCLNPQLFEFTKFGFRKTEKFRTKFLLETLSELRQNLRKNNISLIIKAQKAHEIIPQIIAENNIDTLFFQKEFTKEETEEIKRVKSNVQDVDICEQYEQFLFHPEDIPFSTESIPQVFTDFRKKLEKFATVRPEYTLRKMPKDNLLPTEYTIPSMYELGFDEFQQHTHTAFPFLGGENQALERLSHYFFKTKNLAYYKKTRNGMIGVNYSSKFSPWLSNGSISAKTIYYQVKKFEEQEVKNQSTYWLIFELIWRDYFKYIALKHQNQLFAVSGILNKRYQWETSQKLINKWIEGQTIEPFVNANMLELKNTGWMSNRGRQNVASYFSKELKLDWRIGAAYFESMLIDYDVHSNYGNWQYISGVGNDPRDRKFNIALQAERYDKNCQFRNIWLQKTLF